MGIEQAIIAAVESAGVPWAHRTRVAGAAELASSLAAIVAPLDIGHKKDFLASLIGECAQESDWYCAKQEYGGANASYAPYYGRGFVQLTHRVNYIGFTTYARGRYSSCPDFVANPDAIVFDLKWCWLTGIYYYIANIKEDYWARHDWDSISGIINAGNPNYRGPSWGLRSAACNAAYNALGNDWEDDDMPSAEEVAKAVWAYQIAMFGRSPNAGKTVSAGTIMGWIDDQFSWTGQKVLEAEVERAGLPDDDPRAGKRVSVGAIFAWLDAQFRAVNDRLDALEAREYVPVRAEEVFGSQAEAGEPQSPDTAPDGGLVESTSAADGGDGMPFYGAAPSNPATVADEVDGMPGYYKVARGDTARWVAKRFGISYTDLVRMNPELAGSYGMISTGQLLRVREV